MFAARLRLYGPGGDLDRAWRSCDGEEPDTEGRWIKVELDPAGAGRRRLEGNRGAAEGCSGRTSISNYCPPTLPPQLGWPQRQTSSVDPPAPSQWALQYFEPSAGMQSQVGFAHFLGGLVAMAHSPGQSKTALWGKGWAESRGKASGKEGERVLVPLVRQRLAGGELGMKFSFPIGEQNDVDLAPLHVGEIGPLHLDLHA
jgi:hypothetical protein